MKRAILTSIFFIILLLGGSYLIYLNISTIASNILTRKLDVTTTIKKIDLKPKQITLEDFEIKNPKGSSLHKAMSSQEIQIKTSFSQLIADPIIIDEIALNNVYVSLIISSDQKSACNWNILLKNMNRDKPKWYSIQRTSLIKHLILKNITIEVQLYGKQPQTLSPIDKLEFYNIDVEKGIPTKEISNIIVSKMIGSIFSLDMIKRIIGLPLNALDFIFKPFENNSEKNNNPCPMYK